MLGVVMHSVIRTYVVAPTGREAKSFHPKVSCNSNYNKEVLFKGKITLQSAPNLTTFSALLYVSLV
jgi:hypothetical protein